MSASFRILGCSSWNPAGKFHVFILLPSSCFAHISLACLPDISLFWIQDLLDQGFPAVPVPSEGVQRFPRYSQFGVWVGFWIDGLISCIRKLTKYFFWLFWLFKSTKSTEKSKKSKKVKKVPDFSIVDYSFEKFVTFLTFWPFSGRGLSSSTILVLFA